MGKKVCFEDTTICVDWTVDSYPTN